VNQRLFSSLDKTALSFYQKHGWVVLNQQIDSYCLKRLSTAWQRLINRYSHEIGCDLFDYKQVISQWRNLWQEESDFKAVMDAPLASLAAASFNLPSVRLLHDHIICKTAGGGNGIVPWHQDSMYWPVDRTGMSTWMSYVDVPVEHGCLEVVTGSHQWEVSTPVDFMSNEQSISVQMDTVLLPVKAGEVILLHSRTWHRSQATSITQPRPAHIVLWVPPATRYWQENAAWHPLNEQISVENNALLNQDEFPIFGEMTEDMGTTMENKHEGVSVPFGMFNALDRVQKQVEFIFNQQGLLGDLLASTTSRQLLAIEIKQRKPELDLHELKKTILDVWISAASFERHKARNVFNAAYKKWETQVDGIPFQ
jgi:ectoine hydroxylase-related dioxygenase (phytanoyl-CoA dioxygenase family)